MPPAADRSYQRSASGNLRHLGIGWQRTYTDARSRDFRVTDVIRLLIPIKHENMTARRWPVVTLALIAINVAVFLFTLSAIDDEAPRLGEVKTHILILAALHPELKMQAQSQHLVDGFKQSHPQQWKQAENPNRDLIDAYDAKIRLSEDSSKLQDEMDSLNAQLEKLSSASLIEQYAFIPAHPRPISYLTANFLHGGWLHLIGNM